MPSVLLLRGAAATVMTVAAALLGPAQVAPAAAAGLCSGGGVHVVVDFKELGGGAQRGCDPHGADRAASAVFPAAGFPLTYTQQQAGFVCRVSGKPESDPCQKTPPADAYWGLWWSDGSSGTWTYSSQGVGSLKVPSGGAVAFAWNDNEGASPPGVAPPKADQPTPKPSPTKKPTPTKKPAPTPAPTTGPADPAPAAGAGPSTGGGTRPSAAGATPSTRSPAGRPEQKEKQERAGRTTQRPRPSPSATADVSAQPAPGDEPTEVAPASASSDAASEADDRLPLWVPLGALGLAFAGAAGAVVVRRRSGATG